MTEHDVSAAPPGQNPEWHEMLTHGHRSTRVVRTLFKALPKEPRCKLCVSPFSGVGGVVARTLGFRPSRMNPNFCGRCLERLPAGGAEVDIAVLFADVRGSTALGESLGATAYAGLMNRFYHVATDVLLAHDGLIDKLIGDEVMALFIPGIAGPEYRRRACDAALALLRAVGDGPGGEPWLPVGAGVHAGVAFVGNVGREGLLDFTALGDTVNTAARLQSFASPGQAVFSAEVCNSAPGLPAPLERKSVDVRGKAEPLDVCIFGA
jgi:adenylate cyclase